ncbi:glycerol-3-phosphate dehydrogenase/oxidase [bacterium]|nr:glycerol-3-phosphate dehydrogenase/oxidase [bacterium]
MKKLVVIGGGINGAGIARDAAMRGWDVTLLEKNDFCSGTSWASSKLIHGGLRYLEHGEFGLVRESLREREILLHIHPHNIHPLHILLSVYRYSPHWKTTLRFGMKLYEFLSTNSSMPLHETFTPDQLNEIEPGLDKRELRGGIAYWDAQCRYPERLVLANLHSAEENGAKIYNHHQVIRLNKKDNRVQSVIAKDLILGQDKEFECGVVINAAGPWIDEIVNPHRASRRPMIGGTRGSHIVVPRFTDGPRHAIYSNARLDGRPFFILPWLNYYLIGTTDVRHRNSLDELAPSLSEIDYLITETNQCFPAAEINRNSILFSFSGVRPLPYSGKKNPGAITRRHIIIDHGKTDGITNLISLVGGKLTTYRHAAQLAIDAAHKKTSELSPVCLTDIIPLWGGAMENVESYITNNFADAHRRWNIDEMSFRHLVTLYGTHFEDVLKVADLHPGGFKKICSHGSDLRAQVIYAVRHEWAKTLTDVMLRRTPIGMNTCLGMDACEIVGNLMAGELRWNENKKREEIDNYKSYVTRRLLSHQN